MGQNENTRETILRRLDELEARMADPDSPIWEKDKYTLRTSKACTQALRVIADAWGKPVGDVLQDCVFGFFYSNFERLPSVSRDLVLMLRELDTTTIEIQDEVRNLQGLVTLILADQTRQIYNSGGTRRRDGLE